MILGCTRLYPDALHFLKWTLPPLQRITDRRLFLLCGGLGWGQLPAWALAPPADCVVYDKPWDHYDTLDAAFAAADGLRPEWVAYPDADEILPVPQFPRILHDCLTAGMEGVAFPFAEPFGGFDCQVDRSQVTTGAHLKVLLWRPNLTFHGTPGFCVPQGYWGKAIHSEEPLLHLRYMTEEARALRKRQDRDPFRATLVKPAPPQWHDLYYRP